MGVEGLLSLNDMFLEGHKKVGKGVLLIETLFFLPNPLVEGGIARYIYFDTDLGPIHLLPPQPQRASPTLEYIVCTTSRVVCPIKTVSVPLP